VFSWPVPVRAPPLGSRSPRNATFRQAVGDHRHAPRPQILPVRRVEPRGLDRAVRPVRTPRGRGSGTTGVVWPGTPTGLRRENGRWSGEERPQQGQEQHVAQHRDQVGTGGREVEDADAVTEPQSDRPGRHGQQVQRLAHLHPAHRLHRLRKCETHVKEPEPVQPGVTSASIISACPVNGGGVCPTTSTRRRSRSGALADVLPLTRCHRLCHSADAFVADGCDSVRRGLPLTSTASSHSIVASMPRSSVYGDGPVTSNIGSMGVR
jgi:hypothetical protein